MATEFNIDYDKPTLIWTKWYNPFSNEEIKNLIRKIKKSQGHDVDESIEMPEPVKVAFSPVLGMIPITDLSDPEKTFNFWLGHTNFNITNSISNIIQKTIGVEVFDVQTPYRFRIAIGQAFRDRSVLNRILENIHKKQDGFSQIRAIIEDATKKLTKEEEPPAEEIEKGV